MSLVLLLKSTNLIRIVLTKKNYLILNRVCYTILMDYTQEEIADHLLWLEQEVDSYCKQFAAGKPFLQSFLNAIKQREEV